MTSLLLSLEAKPLLFGARSGSLIASMARIFFQNKHLCVSESRMHEFVAEYTNIQRREKVLYRKQGANDKFRDLRLFPRLEGSGLMLRISRFGFRTFGRDRPYVRSRRTYPIANRFL